MPNPLADITIKQVPIPSSNFTYGRNAVKFIVPHHAVMASLAGVDATFLNPNRAGSTHYGICGSEIHQYVAEGNTAWANSNWDANINSISWEMCNSELAYPWKISDETIDTAARLGADILMRYGLGDAVYGKTVRMHRDFAATQCPGDYFAVQYGIQRYCDLVNKYIHETSVDKEKPMAGQVITWDAHKGDNQLWRVADGGLQNKATGKMLDITGNSKTKGTQLCVWQANGQSNQKFQLVPAGQGYAIYNPATQMYVDASAAGLTDGTPVIVWPKNDQLNQRWFMVLVDDEWFMLLNANSGDALDAVV